jgi:transcriptional regulator with XRE-family HTH domain
MNEHTRQAYQRLKDEPGYVTQQLLLKFCEDLLYLMEKNKVSRDELARRMGVNRSQVTRLLNTDGNTKLETLVRATIAAGGGLSVVVRRIPYNREGLTWTQWTRAAGYETYSPLSNTKMAELLQAWQRGEDPTEYRQ